jgi:hypothetical protein
MQPSVCTITHVVRVELYVVDRHQLHERSSGTSLCIFDKDCQDFVDLELISTFVCYAFNLPSSSQP